MTTLADDQIDRYSRQIIMPEVGGRGQARLLAARVAVVGDGDAAAVAATLLGRAGIGTLALVGGAPPREASPDCTVVRGDANDEADVVVDFASDPAVGRAAARAGRPYVRATLAGAHGVVLTLLGRPCAACLAPGDVAASAPDPRGGTTDEEPLDAPAALAVGALAAGEALRVLVAAPDAGRAHRLDVAAGVFTSRPVPPTGGCPVCGGPA